MSALSVTVGGGSFAGLADELVLDLRPRAERAVLESALLLEGAVKKKLSGQRHGRVYRVPGTKRTYTAAAPGEPPAVRTGALRNSITHEGPTWEGNAVSAAVGTNVEYAALQEYGGMTGRGRRVRVPPHPYFRPAVLETEAPIRARLEAV